MADYIETDADREYDRLLDALYARIPDDDDDAYRLVIGLDAVVGERLVESERRRPQPLIACLEGNPSLDRDDRVLVVSIVEHLAGRNTDRFHVVSD